MLTSAVALRTDALTPTPASARAALERLVDPATPRAEAPALHEVLALAIEEWTVERLLGRSARPCPRCGTTVHQRVDSFTRQPLGPRVVRDPRYVVDGHPAGIVLLSEVDTLDRPRGDQYGLLEALNILVRRLSIGDVPPHPDFPDDFTPDEALALLHGMLDDWDDNLVLQGDECPTCQAWRPYGDPDADPPQPPRPRARKPPRPDMVLLTPHDRALVRDLLDRDATHPLPRGEVVELWARLWAAAELRAQAGSDRSLAEREVLTQTLRVLELQAADGQRDATALHGLPPAGVAVVQRYLRDELVRFSQIPTPRERDGWRGAILVRVTRLLDALISRSRGPHCELHPLEDGYRIVCYRPAPRRSLQEVLEAAPIGRRPLLQLAVWIIGTDRTLRLDRVGDGEPELPALTEEKREILDRLLPLVWPLVDGDRHLDWHETEPDPRAARSFIAWLRDEAEPLAVVRSSEPCRGAGYLRVWEALQRLVAGVDP